MSVYDEFNGRITVSTRKGAMSEQKPLSLEQLREEVAKWLFSHDGNVVAWYWSTSEKRPAYFIEADQILALVLTPEIVGEWIKQHPGSGFVKLDKDQTLPCNMPAPSVMNLHTEMEGERFGYSQALGDMLKAGFHKVKEVTQ